MGERKEMRTMNFNPQDDGAPWERPKAKGYKDEPCPECGAKTLIFESETPKCNTCGFGRPSPAKKTNAELVGEIYDELREVRRVLMRDPQNAFRVSVDMDIYGEIARLYAEQAADEAQTYIGALPHIKRIFEALETLGRYGLMPPTDP